MKKPQKWIATLAALTVSCALIGCAERLTLWDGGDAAFPDEIVLRAADVDTEQEPYTVAEMRVVETESEILPAAIAESEPVPEPETTEETAAVPDSIAEPESVPETIPAPDPLPEAIAETASISASAAESDPNPETTPETEPLPETMPETEPLPETMPEPESTPETTADDAPVSAPTSAGSAETVSQITAAASDGAEDSVEKSASSSKNKVTVPDAEEEGDDLVWVPVNGGTKYHKSATCSKMKEPMQVTRDTAIANGYEPCKRCYGK